MDGTMKSVQRWLLCILGNPGLEVLHSCRNRRCLKHIRAGTRAENHQDKSRDGTGNTQKIPFADVPSIRERLANGEPYQSIADDYDVQVRAIKKLEQGKTWWYA